MNNPFIIFSTNQPVNNIRDMQMSHDGLFVCISRQALTNNMMIFRKNKDNNGFTDLRIG